MAPELVQNSEYIPTYDVEWLSSEIAHPISLSMPLTKNRHTGDLVRCYFDNLLPDDIEIRKLTVDRLGAYSTDTMDLLSEIGRDCVGSLSLTAEPVDGIDELKLETMSERDIAAHLSNYDQHLALTNPLLN